MADIVPCLSNAVAFAFFSRTISLDTSVPALQMNKKQSVCPGLLPYEPLP